MGQTGWIVNESGRAFTERRGHVLQVDDAQTANRILLEPSDLVWRRLRVILRRRERWRRCHNDREQEKRAQ
jgi:hypothetical protein